GHDELLRPVEEDPFHVVDVVDHPRHQLSRGAVRVKPEGELLHLGEHLVSHVEDDLLLQRVVETDAEHVEKIPQKVRQADRRDVETQEPDAPELTAASMSPLTKY